jgi:hypothetical protein
MLLFLLESKVLILKILFFCVIDIIIFIITSQHIRGALAPASVLGTACAYVVLGLLP